MVPWFHGSMVPWFHPGTLEPWNLFCVAWNLGSKVPWFHLKKIGWNHGTMEPWFQATHLRFHGSMVPGWNHGTMEPWNPNVYYVYCDGNSFFSAACWIIRGQIANTNSFNMLKSSNTTPNSVNLFWLILGQWTQ